MKHEFHIPAEILAFNLADFRIDNHKYYFRNFTTQYLVANFTIRKLVLA